MVWQSVEYSETMTEGMPNLLVDGRGKSKDGTYWRYRGMFGDSCSYSKVSQAAAAALDCVLDAPRGK
jgi:hypothetical protein